MCGASCSRGTKPKGQSHEESGARIPFRTKPHATSAAVWDVPSPVIMNRSFEVKVGTKCSAMCQLTGQVLEIRNQAGIKVGEGTLGKTPWPETSALYYTAIALAAPAAEEVSSWTVAFAAGGLSLPHEAASATFTFRTARPPEKKVTIRITAEGTGVPVEDVEVRLGSYVAFTDEGGLATIEVPKDTYDLSIRKDGYTAEPITMKVNRDLTVQVEALSAPTAAETDDRMMEFRDYPWG